MNLLTNASFELWSGGDNVAPDDWAGSDVAKDETYITNGLYSAKLTSGVGPAVIYYSITGENLTAIKGKEIVFKCDVKTNSSNKVYISISDGVGDASSNYHSGNDSFEKLSVVKVIDANAPVVQFICWVETSSIVAYFDNSHARINDFPIPGRPI